MSPIVIDEIQARVPSPGGDARAAAEQVRTREEAAAQRDSPDELPRLRERIALLEERAARLRAD